MPSPTAPLEFVVLDTETTGLEPAFGHEVIEIGAQKIRGREVIGEYTQLIKPTRLIPPDAQRVHGISQADVDQHGVPASQAIPEVVKFIGDAIIVAHNAPF